MNFILLEDRQLISSLEEETRALFRRLGLIKTGKVSRIHFCGVFVAEENTYVFLPRNTGQEATDTPSAASLVLQVLNRYSTSSENILTGSSEDNEDEPGLGLLSIILWLLKDYSTHGLFSTSAKTREINKGKINWNRTVTKEAPLIGVGCSPVYSRLHTERIRYGEQSPVTLIHAEIIKQLDRSFCWAISGDGKVRIAPDLDIVSPSAMPQETKIFELRKELSATYSDRQIKLLKALISFLDSDFEGAAGEYLIGVKAFEGVWEEMLRKILPGVVNINKKLPKPALYLKNRKQPLLSKGMVTDIVAKNGNKVSVIDAKYYRGESIEDSPGWADMVKQFFYAKSLSITMPDCDIANWFAFPGITERIDGGPISTVAVVDTNTMMPLEDDYPPIGCSYFNPLDVMNKYCSTRKYSTEEVNVIFNRAATP